MNKKFRVVIFVLVFMFIGVRKVDAKASDINPSFTDDNFANCVLETYNKSNNTQKTSLTDAELKTIKELYCSYRQIRNIDGFDKLTNVLLFDISYNSLNGVDFSNRQFQEECVAGTCFTYLSIGPKYEIDVEGELGNKMSFTPMVKLPTNMLKLIENVKYVSSNTEIATVDDSGAIMPLKEGKVQIVKLYSYKSGILKADNSITEINNLEIKPKKISNSNNESNIASDSGNNGSQTVKVADTLRTAYIGYCIGIIVLIVGIAVLVQFYRKNKINNSEK